MVVAFFAILACIGLGCRLVNLHLWEKTFLQAQSEARIARNTPIMPHRGMISDRNGVPLAVSSPVHSLWINPQTVDMKASCWPKVCRLLEIDCKTVLGKAKQHPEREFLYLKRHVTPEVTKKVLAFGINGVHVLREMGRFYPTAEVASQVVGATNIDGVGSEGIELLLNKSLGGAAGSTHMLRDGKGRKVEQIAEMKPATPGKDVALSLDMRLQFLAYKELKETTEKFGARSGSVVILDVKTGEVLAMANYPSFNPNKPEEKGIRRNMAVTDLLEPGSVMKTFSTASILESGQFHVASRVDTHPGWMKIGKHVVRDIHNYGNIDLVTVMQKSSNVGISKFILNLPATQLYSTVKRFGFGQPVGIEFPGEQAGFVRQPHPKRPFEQATLAFGYGLAVTPLQIAQAYATLANGGVHVPVTLLKRTEPVVHGERVITPQVAKTLNHILRKVTSQQGSVSQANVAGYTVAGKTGTVRKVGKHGYENRYVALFAGFAPAEDPKLAMIVTVDDLTGTQYYGGQVAAPAFGRLMAASLRILNVPAGQETESAYILANNP